MRKFHVLAYDDDMRLIISKFIRAINYERAVNHVITYAVDILGYDPGDFFEIDCHCVRG